MLPRYLQPAVETALGDTPAVMLIGARQTGKTTLARAIAREGPRAGYVTLDDATALAAALDDPTGFIAGLPDAAIIDEIQKAPDLLPAIKASIDRNRRPGRFLLTGSADVLTLPRVSESLAGRMEVLTLWPLSQGEFDRARESFVDTAFRGGRPTHRDASDDVVGRVLRGGYPEATARVRADRRRAFFDAYVTSLVSRDVRDLAAIETPGALRRLLQIASVRTAAVLNHSELARTLGMAVSTLKRYLALLETMFLVQEVPAWASNRGKRLVRAPKLHVVDTGLGAALSGVEAGLLARDRTLLGPLLASFVAGELRKQVGWSDTRPALHHFRTHTGQEVDIVLEDPRGRIVGVEVKASGTVTGRDVNGLRVLAESAGRAFVQGLVLYLGAATIPFGPNLTACPLRALWETTG